MKQKDIPDDVFLFTVQRGLTVYWDSSEEGPRYTWDGKALRPTPEPIESMLHDVAHWVVCPEERRGLPEFGLGPDADRPSDAKRVVSKAVSDAEESLVCEVQLCLVILFNLDVEFVMRRFVTRSIRAGIAFLDNNGSLSASELDTIRTRWVRKSWTKR